MRNTTSKLSVLILCVFSLSACQAVEKVVNKIERLTSASETSSQKDTSAKGDQEEIQKTRTVAATRLPNTKTKFRNPAANRRAKKKISFGGSVSSGPGYVWYAKSKRLIEIDSVTSTYSSNVAPLFIKATNWLAADGLGAFDTIYSAKPQIFTTVDPSLILIAKYTIKTDLNKRVVYFRGHHADRRSPIVPYSANIGFDYARVSRGYYKIVFRNELKPGQYALIRHRFPYYSFSFAVE